MITNLENTAVQLSATKKDFYQIWNEILELAGKISERWDPTSTNESDPGIVLLKVLTAVADKLNYTIDANTLEAFMPSAAQEESMRKLTEMLGYSMKYYQSATTEAKISYITADHEAIDTNVVIDRFTNLKDRDDSINYVTLDRIELNNENTTKIVRCMEGELVECETDDDNIISILQLDDNNRYFLPETQIAENGIFISNIADNNESDDWDKVDNLNTQNIKTKCYKFGFDSREGLPYIQFPDDISNIIEDGLKIRYIRTNGINGNISVNTLVRMESPKSWGDVTSNTDTNEQNTKDYYNADNYSVVNLMAANNGRNKESLNDAYNNYKKTIGTFDTLVTCRDYMNKIYQMTFSDTDTTNLVSNVIVSDIRDDINKAYTLCTFNEHGIAYEHMARELNTDNATEILQSDFETLENTQKKYYFENNTLLAVKDSANILFYAKCICIKENVYDTIKVAATPISHFDLVFYPFRNVYGLNTKTEYVKSFQYDDSNINEIKQGIEANKTMSHNIIAPEADDLACIKNYLKLNAKITTTKKVNSIEQASILGNIYSSIYANFNMRKIDFGEEIPYDSILTTIENADPRIKNVSLEEPTITTKYCTVSGNEYLTSSDYTEGSDLGKAGDRYYNRLVLNNVLAGRIPLFKYNESFKAEYTEEQYPDKTGGTETETTHYDLIYPAEGTQPSNKIWTIKPSFNIFHGGKDIELNDNEVVQFRLPNLKTVKTYPAYVNYYIHLNQANVEDVPVIPATMQTLDDFIRQNKTPIAGVTDIKQIAYTNLINTSAGGIGISILKPIQDTDTITDEKTFKAALDKYKVLYYQDGSGYKYVTSYIKNASYYYIAIDDTTLSTWHNWITGIVPNNGTTTSNNNYDVWVKLDGFYYIQATDLTRNVGKLVDTKHNKYQQLSAVRPGTLPGNIFTTYYIQKTYEDDVSSGDAEDRHTKNGLGQNGSYVGINTGTEYQLRDDEYLLINYTSSTTNDSEEVKTVVNECYTGKAGVIIKPNFKLLDSLKYRETHSYSKTTGYDFSEFTEIPQPEGMFTLGVNEQIEIRDFAKVSLDEVSSNIYWELQNEIPDENGRIVFNWDEDWVNKTTGVASSKDADNAIALSHTLREGEYFYYTNKEKTDIAYYGSGTKITRTINTPKIYKNVKDSSISSEDIASLGLSAAIPWRAYNFSKADGIDRHIELTEYQYVNLIKGDVLKTVGDINNSGTPDTIEVDISTDSWKQISSAIYKVGGSQKPLPMVNFVNSDFCWEVTSRLELNVSPTETQTLHTSEYTEDVLSLEDKNGNNIVDLKAWGKDYPLSIKTNKLLQGSYTELDVTTKKYTDDGQIEEVIPELEVKVFKVANIINSGDEPITLNNFGKGNFTKFSFEDCLDTTESYAELNIIIPANSFGLIMFYSVGDPGGNAGIKLSSGTPSIYNYNNDSWWSDSQGSDGVYRFRSGLNIVKIPASCKVEIYSDSNKKDIIIFSGLDIVSGINPKLCYKAISEDNSFKQILADINAIDKNHNFYYNAIISNSSNIDLNENDSKDTLENPLSWYNYNNINNKFVISEIDASSLSNSIVIAKSSKL